MNTYQNFINGRLVESPGAGLFEVLNPATDAVISQVPDTTAGQVREAIECAERAQVGWARLPAIQRAGYLRRIAQLVRERAEHFARVITEEQGKTLDLARTEVHGAADYIDYMAEWARRIEGEIITSDRPNENILLFRAPIGVIAGILPWNFPFFLIARKMAPALVTGNTIVIKSSEETPNNAFEFAKLTVEAGLPPGVFNVVSGRGRTTGAELCASPKVGMITFTGSVDTGSRIMAAAAPNITKVNLELGGKAPAIVMADADLDLAVEAVKNSRVVNSGQICNCAERIYVHRRVVDEFAEKMTAVMKQCRYGDPLRDDNLTYGPLINRQGLAKVESLVQGAIQAGATVLTGAKRGDRPKGSWYEPTVLADCRQDMEIIRKEIFGPVVPIVTFDDLDQAIAYANDSEYGLTSSIYTRNLNVALRACNEIRFGETYINRENGEAFQGFHAGWRKSGIGGADGRHGVYEYTQSHVVYLPYDAAAKG